MKWYTLLPLFFCISHAEAAETLTGTVTKVHDGDTIALQTAKTLVKIRLFAIDAPEHNQPHGKKSRRALAKLIHKQQIRAECVKKDKYQRHVCALKKGSLDIGLALLKAGHAWHYKRFAGAQSLRQRWVYSKAEHSAENEKLGLWQATDPTPPWVWRNLSDRDKQSRPAPLFKRLKAWWQRLF